MTRLSYARGVLPDPHRLFQGTGRRLRYLRFTPDAGPTDDQLIEYLDLAVGA